MMRGRFRKWAVAVAMLLLSCGFLSCAPISEEKQDENSTGTWTVAAVERLSLWQDWSDAIFLTEDDTLRAVALDVPSVMIYWASWCPHCQNSREQIVSLSGYLKEKGINVYVVDKLDGEKETKEAAREFWGEEEITLVYDEGAKIYQRKGLRMVPTVIVLDGGGSVMAYEEGQIPDRDRMESMVAEAETGKSQKLMYAVKANLMTTEGGIRTNYLDGNSLPSGNDELSESMGLMLQNAMLAGDRELFGRLLNRLSQNSMLPEGGGPYPWVVTDKQDVTVNAAVDDLRIYSAVKAAQEIWGEVQIVSDMEKALTAYLLRDGKLVDFYDFTYEQYADSLTLCYADFEAMNILGQRDSRWDEACRSTMEIVKGGRISDDFPLYYSRYSYASASYEGEELNMAEAMVTLLHLSRVGELPQDTYQWLLSRLEEGVIYAAYDTDGRPALEKRYESTAVYALAAMVAMEEGDMDMASRALSLMEPMRIYDSTNVLDGLFGGEDGNGIYSFDQCVALEAYLTIERHLSE